MHKLNKGISAPLGVIFGVLLAIILVILAVFIAFNISTTAVKSQAGQLVIVGQPVAFYKEDENSLNSVTIVLKNPTGSDINITGIILEGETFTFADNNQLEISAGQTVTLKIINTTSSTKVTVDDQEAYITGFNVDLSNAVTKGYLELVLITDRGTITVPVQVVTIKK